MLFPFVTEDTDLAKRWDILTKWWNYQDLGVYPWDRLSVARGISPGGYGAGTGATLTSVNQRIVFGNASPSAGAWIVGDKVFNQTPSSGHPKGWICTVAGTPGTWVSEGNL